MSRALKLVSILAVVVVSLVGTTAVFAQGYDDTHLYGLVYVDTNLDGVWQVGEPGYEGMWSEFWENEDDFVKKYVGATVELNPGDPDEIITLETAVIRELADENECDLCTYQDWIIEDGPDEDDELDVNPSPVRPCCGTFGIRPAGPKEMFWEVKVIAPAGYYVTSANPQYVEITSDTPIVEFGIAPTGAGGPTAAPIAILPVTGGTLLGLLAIAAALIGGGTLIVGTKSRR